MHHILSFVLVGLFGLLSMALDPVYAAPPSDDGSESDEAMLLAQAKAHIDAENFAAALPLLEILTQSQPEHAEAWHLSSHAHCRLAELDAAALAYGTLLQLSPDNSAAQQFHAAHPAANKAEARQRIL